MRSFLVATVALALVGGLAIGADDEKTWPRPPSQRDFATTAAKIDAIAATKEENGAATFWITNVGVDKATDTISKVFMGVQLQCAQCHNHPFTGWKQEEYWGMAQFFMKVRLNGNPKNAAKKGVELAVLEE